MQSLTCAGIRKLFTTSRKATYSLPTYLFVYSEVPTLFVDGFCLFLRPSRRRLHPYAIGLLFAQIANNGTNRKLLRVVNTGIEPVPPAECLVYTNTAAGVLTLLTNLPYNC